jgi:hypothetical protein
MVARPQYNSGGQAPHGIFNQKEYLGLHIYMQGEEEKEKEKFAVRTEVRAKSCGPAAGWSLDKVSHETRGGGTISGFTVMSGLWTRVLGATPQAMRKKTRAAVIKSQK